MNVILAMAIFASFASDAFGDARQILIQHCGSCHDSRISFRPESLRIFDLADEQWIRKISTRTLKRLPERFHSRRDISPAEKVEFGMSSEAPKPTEDEIWLVEQELSRESARRRPKPGAH
jgi:hypothetical protein